MPRYNCLTSNTNTSTSIVSVDTNIDPIPSFCWGYSCFFRRSIQYRTDPDCVHIMTQLKQIYHLSSKWIKCADLLSEAESMLSDTGCQQYHVQPYFTKKYYPFKLPIFLYSSLHAVTAASVILEFSVLGLKNYKLRILSLCTRFKSQV